MKDIHDLIDKARKDLILEKRANEELATKLKDYPAIESEIITFNVGGRYFSTFKSTITKKIKKKQNNIDNLPLTEQYYGPSLIEALVNGFAKSHLDKNEDNHRSLLKDTKYYCIYGLEDLIRNELLLRLVIISDSQQESFITLCGFRSEYRWKLLYRASEEGFTAEAFHSKCDEHANTLTILRSENGNIFGGHTSVAWDKSCDYKDDKNSFLFSFVNKNNKPEKLAYKNTGNGIYCKSNYGPTFGGGHDFYIASQSNANNSSYSNLGHSFNSGFAHGSNQAKECLAGSYNFTVKEIEVFQKII